MSGIQPIHDDVDGRELIHEDGYIIDAETGEVLGTYDNPPTQSTEAFMPTDLEGANWVLEKMSIADANIVAIEARLKALMENLQAQKKKYVQRREGLERYFGGALENVARETLEATGWKSKTLTLDHGKVSFHRGRPSCEITSMEEAIEWAKRNAPDLVRVEESVLKSDLEPVAPEDCTFLKRNEPVERVKIETGVKPIRKGNA